MKVCEACAAKGYHERTYRGNLIRVLCGSCLGVGLLSLGHESEARWRELREKAIVRGCREGWHEVVWEGEPGNAKQVVKPMASEMWRDAAKKASA